MPVIGTLILIGIVEGRRSSNSAFGTSTAAAAFTAGGSFPLRGAGDRGKVLEAGLHALYRQNVSIKTKSRVPEWKMTMTIGCLP